MALHELAQPATASTPWDELCAAPDQLSGKMKFCKAGVTLTGPAQ
jgi:hypothetical protein